MAKALSEVGRSMSHIFFAEDDGLSLIFVKDQVTLLITQLEVT